MESSQGALDNFILLVRKLVLSDKRQDKLSVLLHIAHAFDLCADDEEEKFYLRKCLVNIDFPTYLPRLVFSDPLLIKVSMKVVLLMSEDVQLLKTYPEMLAAHLRAFVFLASKPGVADLLIDCFTFFKIIEER